MGAYQNSLCYVHLHMYLQQRWLFRVIAIIFISSILILTAVVLVPYPARAVPANFVNEIIATGLNIPTQLVIAPDGRMFVAEKMGKVVIIPNGASQPLASSLLTLTNIYTQHEAGILGLMLAPDFSTSGHFYVYYTAASPQRLRLSRFTATGNIATLSSEVVIWQGTETVSDGHHGGTITFGPDGKIFILSGDQFYNPPDAQDLKTTKGKALRINPDGSIPTDNPFYDGAGPNKDEIWAYGLRNPFRGSYDQVTGRIIFGDVGGNVQSTAVEEIHILQRGVNYGWPNCEENCGPTIAAPLYAYRHNNTQASVTGGLVYRGTQFPAAYVGSFFFGDFARSFIKRLTMSSSGTLTGVLNFEPENGAEGGPYGNPVDFKEGLDGSLYYLDIGGYLQTGTGKIRRIRYVSLNQPPVSRASADPLSGIPPLQVNFSSQGSSDPEGATLSYSWNFGDNTSSGTANPIHTYTAGGSYTVRLTVSDGVNSVISDPLSINVGNPPVANITSPTDGAFFEAGELIRFSGSGSDPDDGVLPPSALEWTVNFRHEDHRHPVINGLVGTSSGSFLITPDGHGYTGNTSYEITLTATDAQGLKSSKTVSVFPRKVNLDFATSPAGLKVKIDGTERATPFVYDTLIGFRHVIEAFDQISGGANHTFLSWSDGGARGHTITTPPTTQTYTARYATTTLSALLHFPFNETSGTTAADASGNGRNGALINGPVWVAGKLNNGLDFDGVNDHVTVSASVRPMSALSLSFWVKLDAVTGGMGVLQDFNWNAGRPFGYLLDIGSTGSLNWRAGDGTPDSVASSPAGTLVVGQWTHIVMTWENNVTKFYKNGTLIATTGTTDSTAISYTGTAGLKIGTNQTYLNGILDDLRVYNRVLTASEAAQLYNNTLP